LNLGAGKIGSTKKKKLFIAEKTQKKNQEVLIA
jgi:hypothetical protein